jgi:hypothetical protein
MIVYGVACGWARYRQCGDHVREDLQEDFCTIFNTLPAARAAFNAEVAGLADVYKIERATAGVCWQEKRPYASLDVYSRGEHEWQTEDEYLETETCVVFTPGRAV